MTRKTGRRTALPKPLAVAAEITWLIGPAYKILLGLNPEFLEAAPKKVIFRRKRHFATHQCLTVRSLSEDVSMQRRQSPIVTPMLFPVLVAAIVGTPLAFSGDPEISQAVQLHTHIDAHHHAAALQSKCCSCGGAFPREVARLCNSCSNKYRSKCCLCSGAFPRDAARLCNSCTSRFRNKCFLCSGAFPKDIARLCSRCASKY